MSSTITKKDEQLTKKDEQLIEQGKQLQKRVGGVQMKLGKLCLEFAPMGETGSPSGAVARIEMFAEKIDAHPGTMRNARSVAHAWRTTDVGDDELPFQAMIGLRSVGNKEALLLELRAEQKKRSKPMLIKEVVKFAVDKKYLQPLPGQQVGHRGLTGGGEIAQRTKGKRGEATNSAMALAAPIEISKDEREEVIRSISDTLAKLDFSVGDREEFDPLLARVEAEAARLRKQLEGEKATVAA